MINKLPHLSFTFLFIVFINITEAIIIDGNAFLEYNDIHDSIKVAFERTAPTPLFDTTYTDTNGYFTISIETGIYSITYSKRLHLPLLLTDKALYADSTLPDTTINRGLSGSLSGILPSGDYLVFDSIEVDEGDTLIMNPGANLFFKQDMGFNINGLLIAVGSDSESIKFTREEDGVTWGGVNFLESSDDNSKMSYCLIEYSGNSGIRFDNANPTISHMIISNNASGQYGGGGIQCRFSNPVFNHLTIFNNTSDEGGGIYCYQSSPDFDTVFIYNNSAMKGGAIWCNYASPSFKYGIIRNNTGTQGGCLYATGEGGNCSPTFEFIDILGNKADYGGGVYVCETYTTDVNLGKKTGNCKPELINVIVANNDSYVIYVDTTYPDTPNISFSNFWNNGNGNFYNCDNWLGVNVTVNINGDSCDAYNNIIKDPMIADTTTGVLYIGSPCIDAGKDTVNIGFYQGDGVDPMNILPHNNSHTFSDIIQIKNSLNPFTVKITINYDLSEKLTLCIYDVKGKLIEKFHNIHSNTIIWNAGNLSSGIYFCRLENESSVLGSDKIIVFK